MNKLKGKPFALWVSFNGPHPPFAIPEPWSSMYDSKKIELPKWDKNEFNSKPIGKKHLYYSENYAQLADGLLFHHVKPDKQYNFKDSKPEEFRNAIANYYGFISLIDKNIGRILKNLEELGLDKNTIVVFTSDHGDYMGEHAMMFKDKSSYDATVRVPLIVRHPLSSVRGGINEDLISNVDYLPTLLEFLNIPIDSTIQGRSFAPIFFKKNYQIAKEVFFEIGRKGKNNERLFKNKAIRTKKWKYIYNLYDKDELYNLEKDPGELANVIDNKGNLEVLNVLKTNLLQWLIMTDR